MPSQLEKVNAAKAERTKNPCLKTRLKDNPYEVWLGNLGLEPNEPKDSCKWLVLKKWQTDDRGANARWFCFVTSPYCPEGEYGDCYVRDITSCAVKVP